jgi:bacteriophage exclusion system BrxA-like protein
VDETRSYTTQLQAGLGMVHETLSLLRLWEPSDNSSKLSEKAIQQGVFSRTTARRTHNIVSEMFAPRFLGEGGKAASHLKVLIEANLAIEDLSQLFFIYTARAQAVFADFVTMVYWPRYSAGVTRLTRAEAEAFIQRALDNGRMQKRWTPITIRRVSGYLLSCCSDFGLLGGKRRGDRTIQRFAIRSAVSLYLAHDLHFSGQGDLALTRHRDWALFGLEPQEVVNEIKALGSNGHLIIQSAVDLVQISWKYKSMEDCLRAITQR